MLVHVQHDTGGCFPVLLEEAFENMNDELHRGIIVVEQKDPVKTRPFGFRLCARDDGRTAIRVAVARLPGLHDDYRLRLDQVRVSQCHHRHGSICKH